MSSIKVLIFSIIFIRSIILNAQEVPAIVAYDTKDYNAASQNWDIDQDCNGLTYIANSNGVLIFNGLSWQLVQLPHNKRPRTIFVGSDCKTYVAGYEFFGYIDNSQRNKPTLVPLADSILSQSGQEIWAMYGDEKQIVFQSFADVYVYDYSTVFKYLPPENIMLGNAVNNEFFIPKISGGIMKFLDGSFTPIEVTNQFANKVKVAAVLEGTNSSETLIATQFNGLFLLNSNIVDPIQTDIVSALKEDQINRVIRLKTGGYVIGTILNGLYVLDDKFQVLFHINKSNGLSNNTVLALYESKKGDLWVGLDKGINLIKLSEPERYYYDKQGKLGTVYASINHKGAMYLGTNQGVFMKTTNGSFELIRNSQGQVWSFAEMGNNLICGHNNGTFIIEGNGFRQISSESGGLCFQKINDSTLIESTYRGLYLIKYNDQKISTIKIEDSEVLLEKFVLNDHTIVGYHTYFGIYDIDLSENFTKVISSKITQQVEGQDINKPSLLNYLGEIYIYSNNLLYRYREGIIQTVDKEEKSRLLKVDDFSEIKARIIYENLNRGEYNYNEIKQGSTKKMIVSFDEGYKLLNELGNIEVAQLEVDYVTVNGVSFDNLVSNSLEPYQNDILICLKSDNSYSLNDNIQYKLLPWDNEWRLLPANGKLNFLNLKHGEYTLWIKSNGDERSLLKWTIEPNWYESWKGLVLYLLFFISLVLFLNRKSKLKMEKELQKLEVEKEKEVQKERLKVRADNLEIDLLHKSKMLANRTMTIVQKNKMLNELKQLIHDSDSKHEKTEKISNQRIVHLIENNINSDHDWEIFEKNFAEVHKDFLATLRTNFPEISSSELRLAAYIKMNLSSKEIAPLMNISVRSTENKRYRLRKKLEVPSVVSLSDFIFKL